MGNFIPFAQKTMGFEQAPQVKFLSNPKNAGNALGKTAYYDPNKRCVALYIDDRHPKDIMRSLSHELVHHTQNLRGDLQDTSGLGEQGYAQADEHLREMEREAYETGNLCFRDWEDGYKKEQGNIIMESKRSEELQQQLDLYSDMFKDREGFRPKWIYDDPSFDTVEKVSDAIEQLGPLGPYVESPEDWDEFLEDDDDLDTMIDINYDIGSEEKDQEWAKWWNKTQGRRRSSDPEPDSGPVPGGSTSARFPGADASELSYRKGSGAGHRSAKVSRGAGSRRRDKEEISAQLQEAIAKSLLNNPKLLKEALSKKQKFAQVIKGQLENKMKKKQHLSEKFVRKVVRRYLAEMGDPLKRATTMDDVMSGGAIGQAGDPYADSSMTDFRDSPETCVPCAMGDYCPEHDPANMQDDCPDCAMGNCPVHDTLYEGEMPAGLKAYMDKKRGKKSDDDKDDDKDGDKKDAAKDDKEETNESKTYIPENRSMYGLHDQRLFESLSKWAVKK